MRRVTTGGGTFVPVGYHRLGASAPRDRSRGYLLLSTRPRPIPYPYNTVTESPSYPSAWDGTQTDYASVAVKIYKFDAGAGNELMHHHVTVDWEGDGDVDVHIVHYDSDDYPTAKMVRHTTYKAQAHKVEVTHSSNRRSYRYAWVVVRETGVTTISAVTNRYWVGIDTEFGHYRKSTTHSVSGDAINYRIMYPHDMIAGEQLPIVFSVQGADGFSAANDNERHMELVIGAKYLFDTHYFNPFIRCISVAVQQFIGVSSPYNPSGSLGAPTSAPEAERHPDWAGPNENGYYCTALLQVLDELIADPSLNIDEKRVYVTGNSWGGKAVYELAKQGRDRIAAIWATAGWAMGSNGSDPSESEQLTQYLIEEVERYKHLAVYISHATGDTKVKVWGAQAVYAELDSQDADVVYHEIAGGNHNTAALDYADAARWQWIFSKKLDKTIADDPYPGGVYPARLWPDSIASAEAFQVDATATDRILLDDIDWDAAKVADSGSYIVDSYIYGHIDGQEYAAMPWSGTEYVYWKANPYPYAVWLNSKKSLKISGAGATGENFQGWKTAMEALVANWEPDRVIVDSDVDNPEDIPTAVRNAVDLLSEGSSRPIYYVNGDVVFGERTGDAPMPSFLYVDDSTDSIWEEDDPFAALATLLADPNYDVDGGFGVLSPFEDPDDTTSDFVSEADFKTACRMLKAAGAIGFLAKPSPWGFDFASTWSQAIHRDLADLVEAGASVWPELLITMNYDLSPTSIASAEAFGATPDLD